MNARLTAAALALAWSGVLLAGCTERPTGPLVATKPLVNIGALGVTGVTASIEHEDVPLLYTGQALELSGAYIDASSRPAVSWAWAVASPLDAQYTFSDATLQYTTFTATDPADYVLTLVVCVQGAEDPEPECSRPAIDPEFDEARLEVHAVVNQLPDASITVEEDKTTVQVGELVCFNAYSSYDPEEGPLEYWWDFGEGFYPYGESTCHTYTEAGEYTVTLEVRDEREDTDQASVYITVTQPSPPTPQEAIQSLMDEVTTLVSQGQLSADRGAGMTSKLSAALTSLNSDLTTDACKQLKAFVNQVTASIKAKKLSSATGQALIASAQEIRTQIGCA
jgi:PKD repeat protein